MADLPTNFLDDILSASMGGKKKFRLTYRNGTTEEVTIEDISEYDQYGSKFGAGDINRTNQAVNEKFDSGDVVDPMLTTEPGFAADAYKTKLQFDEQNKNMDNLKFEYLNIQESKESTVTNKKCTILEDGWYRIYWSASASSNTYATYKVNNVNIAYFHNSGSIILPLKSGSVVTFEYTEGAGKVAKIS